VAKVHKTIGEARDNLRQAASQIPTRYKTSTARANWAEPAASEQAETNYQSGVQEAISQGKRVKGIQDAGDQKYRQGCADKGAAVIGERITKALPIYERNFSPVLSAMNNAADSAPPRTRDFRTNVTNRLLPVIEAAKQAAGK
jgi:hypothetical protein